MRMAAVSIWTARPRMDWPRLAVGSSHCAGAGQMQALSCRYRHVSSVCGCFLLPEHDFGIPAVAALRFILGRMPRE